MTDKCLDGLAVRVLTQNVRGIGFNSHPGLKLFSHRDLGVLKNKFNNLLSNKHLEKL